MTPAEIIAIVEELDPHQADTWIAFARMIARHCAEVADEAAPGTQAGAEIRELFRAGSDAR